MPFSEYWSGDLPRSFVERVAAASLFPAPGKQRWPGDDVVQCGPELRVQLSREPRDVRVLSLDGPIDLSNVTGLRAAIGLVLSAERPAALILDAAGVTHGSLRGLTVLVEAADAAAAAGAAYAVAGLTPLHLRMLREVWPLRDLTHIEHTAVPAAMAALTPPR